MNSSTLVGETLTDDINVITWFVKDNNGNETNCQFELRLVDSTRPNLSLINNDITLSNGTYTVTYDEIIDVAASSDFCDIDWSTVVLSKDTFDYTNYNVNDDVYGDYQ